MTCLECGAKINLSLRVGNLQENGLHEIRSVFLPLKHPSDKILVEQTSGNRLELVCNWANLGNEDNLLHKTWKIFSQRTGLRPGLKVYLRKNIPAGAGLGGGSANAGIFLKYLNSLTGKPLPDVDLLEIALKIGSDVPFFLDSSPAQVEASGEKITKLNFRNSFYLVFVWPEISVSTASIFHQLDMMRLQNRKDTPEKNLTKIKRNTTSFSSEGYGMDHCKFDKIHNDLEIPAFEMYPALRELKNAFIRLKANFAGMSGSGSTIFGIFADITTAKKAVQAMLSQYRHVYFAKWPPAGV